MDNNEITIRDCLLAGKHGVDISNEKYHALPGISGSNLELLAESNKHLDNKALFSLGKTPALSFGSLFHTLVLERGEFSNRYAFMPKFESKAKIGFTISEQKEIFKKANEGKEIIDEETFNRASDMCRNVRAICGDLIDLGIRERSLFVDLEGVICKCRLDVDLEEVGDDYDLKSITLGLKPFSDHTLEQHIKKLNYHRSAAFRNIIRRALGKPVRDSFLIFCDTGPGHRVRVIQIAPGWIAQAENEVQDLLESRRFYLNTKIDNPVSVIDDSYRKIL